MFQMRTSRVFFIIQLSLLITATLAEFSGVFDDGEDKYDDSCNIDLGYELIDGFCKPTCSSGCPNGVCVEVNECRCVDGYKAVHGICLAIDLCVVGYVWNEALEICMPQENYQKTTKATFIPNKVSVVWTHVTPVYLDSWAKEKNEEVAGPAGPLWAIALNEESTEELEKSVEPQVEHEQSEEPHAEHEQEIDEIPLEEEDKCSHGFIYYNGDCRPRIYTQSDCNPDLCGMNMQCTESGDYECLPGYLWEHESLSERASCIPSDVAQFDSGLKRLVIPKEDLEKNKEEENKEEVIIEKIEHFEEVVSTTFRYKIMKVEIPPPSHQRSSWVDNFFNALGVSCVVLAVLFLVFLSYRSARK